MPDLNDVLAAEAERQQPTRQPDFATIVRARRRRDRTKALSALASVVAVVASIAVAVPALQGPGDSDITPADPTPAPAVSLSRVTYELTYTSEYGAADLAAKQACLGMPGALADVSLYSRPPIDRVTFMGDVDGAGRFEACLQTVPHGSVKVGPSVPLQQLSTFHIEGLTSRGIDDAGAKPNPVPARGEVFECAKAPTAGQLRRTDNTKADVLAGGTRAEVTQVQDCLTAIPGATVTVTRSQTATAAPEQTTEPSDAVLGGFGCITADGRAVPVGRELAAVPGQTISLCNSTPWTSSEASGPKSLTLTLQSDPCVLYTVAAARETDSAVELAVLSLVSSGMNCPRFGGQSPITLPVQLSRPLGDRPITHAPTTTTDGIGGARLVVPASNTTVSGVLQAVGDPLRAANDPIRGVVTMASTTGLVGQTTSATDGTWSVRLPAGVYTFQGGGSVDTATCISEPVWLAEADVRDVQVNCHRR